MEDPKEFLFIWVIPIYHITNNRTFLKNTRVIVQDGGGVGDLSLVWSQEFS